MKIVLIIIALSSTLNLCAQKEHKQHEPQKIEANVNQSEVLKKAGIDPVCKMKVKKGSKITHTHKGQQYGFCNEYCREVFLENPDKYINK